MLCNWHQYRTWIQSDKTFVDLLHMYKHQHISAGLLSSDSYCSCFTSRSFSHGFLTTMDFHSRDREQARGVCSVAERGSSGAVQVPPTLPPLPGKALSSIWGGHPFKKSMSGSFLHIQRGQPNSWWAGRMLTVK